MGHLRDTLSLGNVTDVSFMIVNEQEPVSSAVFWQLQRRAPPGVPVYQQAPRQPDVWELLDGDKDDFLVYDRWGGGAESGAWTGLPHPAPPPALSRCGQLTFHIGLPYSFLKYTYVEAAVRATYGGNICNCSVSTSQPNLIWAAQRAGGSACAVEIVGSTGSSPSGKRHVCARQQQQQHHLDRGEDAESEQPDGHHNNPTPPTPLPPPPPSPTPPASSCFPKKTPPGAPDPSLAPPPPPLGFLALVCSRWTSRGPADDVYGGKPASRSL